MDKEEGEEEGSDDDEVGLRDAAAALLVGVGSAYDPAECQGMAHFMEHLLFLGSEKYPSDHEFSAFVSKHGGSDNAWTAFEDTVYHLSIPQEYLWPALDRLVQHFKAPLLLESCVDRELQAIESEFQLNKPSDECRRLQLQAATSRPNHVFGNFGWGNLRSLRDVPERLLKIDTLKELRKFFDRYYYAANMRLVVMGAYSLDHLQRHVEELFQGIPALPRLENPLFNLPINPSTIRSWETLNTGYNSPLRLQGMPWDEQTSLGKLFRIVPTKERHRLVLNWQIPALIHKWKAKPCDFLAHLLGHEGAGSLLSYFRSQHWASGCEAGLGDDDQASSAWIFTFGINLTEEGLGEWKQIIQAVYQYLGLLRQYSGGSTTTGGHDGWPKWIFQELQQMDEVSHLYSDEETPEDFVTNLVESMSPHLCLPPDRILDGMDLLFEFDSGTVNELLQKYLIPTNMRVELASSTFGNYADLESVLSASAIKNSDSTDFKVRDLIVHNEMDQLQQQENGGKLVFNPSLWEPQIEPNFETIFWCSEIPSQWIEEWSSQLIEASQPPSPVGTLSSLPFNLPSPNPYVPSRLDLKEHPPGDSDHVLLDATVKVCSSAGGSGVNGHKKKGVKQWFPATVVQYDRKTNRIKLCYEDEVEQWHKMDGSAKDLKPDVLVPDYEGTLDDKKTKFRIVSLALAGVTRRFGDESESGGHNKGHSHGDLERCSFPPLPPLLPPNRLPKELCSSNVLRLWHLQDRNFHRPMAEMRLQVMCAGANETPLHRACAELCVELLWDACLETVTYLAGCAQLSSTAEATCSGFFFRFNGFDDKLLVLFQEIFRVFLSFRQGQSGTLPENIADRRFDACLELLRRRYTNNGTYSSDYCNTLRLQAIRRRRWSANKKMQAIADLTIPVFAKTVSSMLESFAVECLLHGNLSSDDAQQAKQTTLSMIEASSNGSQAATGLKRQKYPPLSIYKIPAVATHSLITVPSKNPTEANTCVEVYVQVGKDTLWERVLIDVLAQIMDDPIYTQLRTKDAFGYDVSCETRWTYGITGILFRVVSNVKSATEIVQRIDRFLLDFRNNKLAKLTDQELVEHLVGMSQHKLEMFNSLSEETSSYWYEIVNGRFRWQVWRDEAVELRKVTKVDVLKAFDTWLHPEKPKRHIMAVQVIGGEDGSNVAVGKPEVPAGEDGDYADAQIEQFHRLVCKNQTWGRVNTKLA
ncbi:hypothetical protein ACA910_002594 [Epithemia clementina (nom. ined.)]